MSKAVRTTFGPGAEPIEGGSGNAELREYVDGVATVLQDQIDAIEASDVEQADLDAEEAARIAGDVALADDVTAEQTARADGDEVKLTAALVSTDGSGGLPAPTGTGLEFVITANSLDDIRWNGA